jgi:diphthine-ammonia ligase
MPRRSTCVLFSGGKDSTRAIELVQKQGYDVSCLITLRSLNEDSYMLHTASINWTTLSSKALGIPLVFGDTTGEKETELQDIQETIEKARTKYGFDAITSGGLASRYQKDRIDRIASNLGLDSIAPLWGINQSDYMMEIVSIGYSIILTSVSTEGLDVSWLGRVLSEQDVRLLDKLSKKNGFNIGFEGGEAESFVLDCPIFTRGHLRILESHIDWRGSYGKLIIKKMDFIPKTIRVSI